MPRVIVAFCAGLIASFAILFTTGQFVVNLVFQAKIEEKERSLSREAFQAWHYSHIDMPLFVLSLGGGFMCGSFCGIWTARNPPPAPTKASRRRTDYRDLPLDSKEFQRLLSSCTFAPLAERDPLFVQGLLVGRLVENDPELARKVDGFSPRHMAALWVDLQHASRRI